MLQLIHSSTTWDPDLTSPAQVDQMEQNWPGFGASDAELAAWARLYGVACLELAAEAPDHEKALSDEFDAGVNSRDEEVEALEKQVEDLKLDLADERAAIRDLEAWQGVAQAVAAALEDAAKRGPLTAGDMRILADRLRKGF